MKIAAYQAPLLAAGSMGAPDLIRARVRACETEGVAILCCPEAILGPPATNSSYSRERRSVYVCADYPSNVRPLTRPGEIRPAV